MTSDRLFDLIRENDRRQLEDARVLAEHEAKSALLVHGSTLIIETMWRNIMYGAMAGMFSENPAAQG